MNFSDYCAIDAVNWSSLKNMRTSPKAYQYGLTNKRADTDSLMLGRLVHALVFEPYSIGDAFAIWDGGRRAGKEWEAFKAANEGVTIVRDQDWTEAEEMASAIRSHPLVLPYLAAGQFEQTLMWTDQATGLECKARADWLIPERRILIDLKTAADINGPRFGAAAGRYGYHCQLAHYAAGVEASIGWKPDRVLIIAAEKTAPYDCAVFEVTEDYIYLGACEVAELLQKVQACTVTGNWHWRYVEEQALELPGWMTADDSDEDENFGLIFGA